MGLVERILESSALGALQGAGGEEVRSGSFLQEGGAAGAGFLGRMGPGMGMGVPGIGAGDLTAAWENNAAMMAGGSMGGGLGAGNMVQAQMAQRAMQQQQQMMMMQQRQQQQHMMMQQQEQHYMAQQAQAQAQVHHQAQATAAAQREAHGAFGAKDASMPFVDATRGVEAGIQGVDEVEDFWNQMSAATRGLETPKETSASKEAYQGVSTTPDPNLASNTLSNTTLIPRHHKHPACTEAWKELTDKLETEKYVDHWCRLLCLSRSGILTVMLTFHPT